MHDISLYLLEMLENSINAGATVVAVRLTIDRTRDALELTVEDDGRGFTVAPEEVLDPFYTTKKGKKTGLGLSLFKAEAEAAGGCLSIAPSSSLGGARVDVVMRLGHIDRPPLGDIATSLFVMAATNPETDFRVSVSDDLAGESFVDRHVAAAMQALERCTKELARQTSGSDAGAWKTQDPDDRTLTKGRSTEA